MHQTTIRFSEDVWEELEAAADALGISVAQYIREAVVARMVYVAGRRGDPARDRALRVAGASEAAAPPRDEVVAELRSDEALERVRSQLARAEAVLAQAELARQRAYDEMRDGDVRSGRGAQ
jgi:hypothetical protein